MNHNLAPSKSTVYVSNLPFDLKNNDLHKIFEKYGKLVKVTVLKDKNTRKSRGVAFLLFLNREDAHKCVQEVNLKEMFGRTLKASIAKDNGRSSEFIRRREYPDKTKCYECGEEGHLSYNCSKNLLGEREPPPKKIRKRKTKSQEDKRSKVDLNDDEEDDQQSDEVLDDCETLSAAIALEREKQELQEYQYKVAAGDYSVSNDDPVKKKKIKKSDYFSDEEEFE